MQRVLIIKLGAFGDLTQVEGAIHDIRDHHPAADIIVMTTPPYKKIMARCPWIDKVFIDPRASRWRLDKMADLRARLRDLRIDMVYDLQQVGRTAFYHRWLLRDVPWIIGGTKGARDRAVFKDKGTMDLIALQLARAGLPTQHALKPDLNWMADNINPLLAAHKIQAPVVVLIPGASAEHDEKRWPYYDELAAWLTSQGKTVVTAPGPDELELCRQLNHAVMLTDGKRYLNLFELAGLLQKAELVVGNDTGPTHLAAHLGIPGLALFSGHLQPTHTGIQHSRFAWLQSDDLRNLNFARVKEALPTVRNRQHNPLT